MEEQIKVVDKTLKSRKTQVRKKIPQNLIYEVIDGKPIYYKGYKQVLNNEKNIEDIMGSSGLQSLIIDCIVMFLHDHLPRKIYKTMHSELGVHLDKNNNLATDIAIYEKSKLKQSDITENYMTVAPKVVIEVDTKADLNDFDKTMDYLSVKTKKLYDFGVEKVFWILTKSRLIIETKPTENWSIIKWSNEINVVDDYKFSIDQLLREDGIIS